MRSWRALWVLGLSMTGPGCALVEDASRNLCVAASTPIEVHREKARNDRWAEAAWQAVTMKDGPCAHSEDFARGFKDGFAEYLFRGGDGEPPLVAPLHYRQYRYQNEKGYQAVQDWFAGYRVGSIAARDSGARRWITSPSALQTELHGEPPPHDAPIVVPIPLPPEQKEVIPLPAPKQLPKEQLKELLPKEQPKELLPKEQPKEVPQVPPQTTGASPRFGELPKELPPESPQTTAAPPRFGPVKVDLSAPREATPPINDEPMMKAKVTGARIAPSPEPETPSTNDEPVLKAKVTGARAAPPPLPEPPVLPKTGSSELPMPRIGEGPVAVDELNNRDMLRARIQRIMSGSPKD